MAAMALGETKGGDSKSMERRKMVNTDIATPKQPCVTFSGAAAADCDGQQQPAKCQAAKRQAMTTEQAQAMNNVKQDVKKVRLG